MSFFVPPFLELARFTGFLCRWYNKIYESLPKDALDGLHAEIYEELGVRASTFEQFLARSEWRVKQ